MTINWNGTRRWIALLLVLAGIGVTLFSPPVIPVIQLPGEVYPGGWKLFGFIPLPSTGLPMTNTIMGSVVVWILLGLLMFYVSRNMPKSRSEVPRGGFYNFFEMVFEGLYDFVTSIVGGSKHFDTIFKMFVTIFFVVLLSNWQSIIPGVDSIGFLEPHLDHETGELRDGYDVYRTFFGAYALNPKCPWVSPEESALLTDEERATRVANGCVSGISTTVEHTEEAVPIEAVIEGEATAEATTEGEAAVTEGEEPAAEAVVEGEAEAEHVPGDPHLPWVVLPYLRPPSTDLNMTLALALVSVVVTHALGFRELGFGYLVKFFNFPSLIGRGMGGVDFAVGLLELLGEIVKILSFAFRLLGNVFAGSVLLFVMSFLLPFMPWPFFILEFFVGLIQALVFGLLTAIFMNSATVGHHHEEEHGEAHA